MESLLEVVDLLATQQYELALQKADEALAAEDTSKARFYRALANQGRGDAEQASRDLEG